MKNVKKLLALLLALAMVAGLLVACGSSGEEAVTPENESQEAVSTEGPQYGGHLDLHMVSKITGLDPVWQTGTWKYYFTNCVWEGPLTRDADNNIVPGVCDFTWDKESLTLTMWPREGITFHDGSPVEAEDVEASVYRVLNTGGNFGKRMAPYIEEMYCEDGKFIIILNDDNENFWSRFVTNNSRVGVIPKEICEKYPGSKQITEDLADAIGTGPYKITDFEMEDFVTIERYEDYVPVPEGHTGMGAPKMAYLDSMTFWVNQDLSSVAMALLAGEYDITDSIQPEYMEMAAAQGIVLEEYNPMNTGFVIYFNCATGENICNQYPDLRKAVMAAIDMYEFAEVVGDNQVVMGRTPVAMDVYETDIFTNADWYGEANQEAVDKYLAAARAAGYNDEPVRMIASSSGEEAWPLICDYLEKAGINYKVTYMDAASAAEATTNPNTDWDIKYAWPELGWTPATMNTRWMGDDNYISPARDAIKAELLELDITSQEYMDKWQELAQVFMDECVVASFGTLNQYWAHPEDFVIEYEGKATYFYNSYWKNPAEHMN